MKAHNIVYFIKEGVKSIFLHGFMSFAAVTVIVACLIIVGSFSLIAVNVNNTIDAVAAQNEVLAFIDEELGDAEARSVGSRINALDNVKSSTFVTKEEAFDEYRNELGDQQDILTGMEEDNPLRHRYRIFLEDIEFMADTVTAIEGIPGVANVRASLQVSDSIMTLRNIVNVISYILGIILISVSVFIIANTVKLATFDRREEIAIMKMVGATNAFIRWPFVFEGFLLGITGAAVGFVFQWGLYEATVGQIAKSIKLIEVVPFASMGMQLFLIFLAAGFLVGVGGSVLTIRRFMQV
ncbi:permease-like cell division protein FtsX [Oscillospiraceae bacterium OttesenSCG-928-G22]|nr:permease-like cell division protein FtsX [Oscillospiraceae bacterium OttesenSCG-928-G22]